MVRCSGFYCRANQTEKEKKGSIIHNREFKSLKQVTERKTRLPRQQGKGKQPNQWGMTRIKRTKKSHLFACILFINFFYDYVNIFQLFTPRG